MWDLLDGNLPHDSRDKLLFGVRKSVRYHDKREGFFLTVRNAVDLTVFLLGSTAALLFTETFGSSVPLKVKVFVPLVAVLGTGITLVLQVGAKAILHNSLKRRFIALEQELIACEGRATAKRVKKLQMERLAIESDEPPVLEVLNRICHNETVRAMDLDRKNIRPVSPPQRLFSRFFDYRVGALTAFKT